MREKNGLTERQRDILDFIVEYQAEHGKPPTVRDIMHEFGIFSPNGVVCTLRLLTEKQYIARPKRQSRNIVILDTGRAETIWGSLPIGA